MAMFSSLSEKLENAFKKFRSRGKLTEADVKAGMREIKLALLEADVNFKVVKDFVRIRALCEAEKDCVSPALREAIDRLCDAVGAG